MNHPVVCSLDIIFTGKEFFCYVSKFCTPKFCAPQKCDYLIVLLRNCDYLVVLLRIFYSAPQKL